MYSIEKKQILNIVCKLIAQKKMNLAENMKRKS